MFHVIGAFVLLVAAQARFLMWANSALDRACSPHTFVAVSPLLPHKDRRTRNDICTRLASLQRKKVWKQTGPGSFVIEDVLS
jgi:hypothetical protein